MPQRPNTTAPHPNTRALLVLLCIAAGYFALAKLTFMLPVSNNSVQMVNIAIWPAAGLAFAAYWRYGWPALLGAFVGALVTHYSFDYSLSPLKLTTSIANILPPLVARWLLLRSNATDPFGSIPSVMRYALYACLLAPLLNTGLSMLALWWFNGLTLARLLLIGPLWWSADVFAMLLVAPALLTWRDWLALDRRRWLELGILVAAILFLFWQLFVAGAWTWAAPLSLLLLPPIYVALLRFNFGVMSGISLLVSILGVVAASSAQDMSLPSRNHYLYLLGFLTTQAIFNIVMCSGLAAARRTFDRLTVSEERFRAVFEQAALGVVIHDIHTWQHFANRKLSEMLGYSETELARLDQADVIFPDDVPLAEYQTQRLLAGEISSAYQELRYIHRDGSILWMGVTQSLIRSQLNNADFGIALFQDISARKSAEADAERLALYDYLTGLPNRRLFGDRLHKAIASARRSGNYGALIYIDLDNFKNLNDAHGHSAGDEMLRMVATRLQKSLRDEDTVARLGGDEFVVLLQNISVAMDEATDAIWVIARKILLSFQEPFLLASGIEFFITASIGVTLFPKSDESAEELLKEADIAMYRVKDDQRNGIRFYATEMLAEANLRVSLERDLRRALQREEFRLYLQPQYNAARDMVGAEVLLRWPHREGKMIPPTTFIPIAEETGLIVPLGELVLRGAAKMIRQFELSGQDISVSVNVSPRQFQESNFVERVRNILWESGADAGRLIIEITEGVVVADFDDARTKLEQLKVLGIRLSVDDFGTGHSSLAYLKRLPLHELKIDRAFIKDLPHDSNDAALVEAILAMSKHLQLEVVAEGVETHEQYLFLKRRGCHRFQGFYFGHPQPAEEYFECLKSEPVVKYKVD